jgi:sulfhydrogenase subunit alpha
MSENERKIIEIPEICRVEGHSAVTVDIQNGKVVDVKLDVFEGTRFFERIVIGHKYDEIPHITSRVCAICSTGHVLAAIYAIERIFNYRASTQVKLYRELMHLGMIIESHATHICALALPDFLGTPDLMTFATKHKFEFEIWTNLRNLGAKIQTIIGGRPFHPVNLHVGGISRKPDNKDLKQLLIILEQCKEFSLHLCKILLDIKIPIDKTAKTAYLALIPEDKHYGYFGEQVLSSDGWHAHIDEYKQYLAETVVPYSHAKQSKAKGQYFMVGAMARLFLFRDHLGKTAASIYAKSPLAQNNHNTILNNLAQAIEIMEAIERAQQIIESLIHFTDTSSRLMGTLSIKAGQATGAVECPRGTLYHYYSLDNTGNILSADMITPSAQNTARIEHDIYTVVENELPNQEPKELQANLETLVRAYDPCNTCATHMVQIKYSN